MNSGLANSLLAEAHDVSLLSNVNIALNTRPTSAGGAVYALISAISLLYNEASLSSASISAGSALAKSASASVANASISFFSFSTSDVLYSTSLRFSSASFSY